MTSRALRRLLRGADPREEVLVVTRPRAHRLVGSFVVLLVIVAVAGFSLGWLSRRHTDPVLVSVQPVLLLAVVVAAAAAAGVFVLRPFLRWHHTRYVLTTARMIRRDGGRRGSTQVWLAGVLHVHISQNLRQRLVRAGDLYLDAVSGRLVLPDAPHVRRFADVVTDAVNRSRPGHPMAGYPGPGHPGADYPGAHYPGAGWPGPAGPTSAMTPFSLPGGTRGR
ncbi:hypothetical protein BKD30_11000 [Tersicoccus phoenicis]|uniref:DUF304 domain-containing protein n=1 Tax=Tersicoccus phoenicis TaxID=554083 RepID=A0A1R1L8M1_9MICC|nr:PH domain-containing protein [Tersicoccus phoenicis]OMH23881.1 hypothetical protein BKD30_11000 [Tersicoccus phoenicis]